MTLRQSALLTAAALAATLGVAACNDAGHTSVSSTPSVSTTTAAPALQPGNYPTTAQAPKGLAGNAENGAILDAQRMADYVVGPWEVDADLITPNPRTTLVLKNTVAVPLVFDTAAVPVLDAHQFVNGFATDRSSAGAARLLKRVSNVVLRFPDEAAAAAAAADLSAQVPNLAGASAVSIANHPNSYATAADQPDGTYTVTSWTPTGPYVVAITAKSPDSRDAAALLVSKMLDLQVRRLADFVPTDPAGFPQLPIDPTGLFARTLPVNKDEATVNLGVWQPRAILHFQSNPVESAKLLKAADVDAVAVRKTKVYQAKDVAGTQLLADKLAESIGRDTKPTDGVAGLAAARCFDAGGPKPDATPDEKFADRYTCVAAAGRYVVTASSQQATDVQQQIAAQVMMLGGQ